MTEAVFKSTLSNDEILNNFKEIDFFSGLITSLEEALAFEKGEKTDGIVVNSFDVPDNIGQREE